MSETVLATEGLTRHFEGLAAVAGVSLTCEASSVHAVIGPNGAGKSTLVNMLSGDLVPSGGRIILRGADVTGLPAHRISRLGVGRSYQKTNIFLPFTARENCRLAAQSRLPSSMRFFRPARAYRLLDEAAARALAAAGLEDRGEVPAAALSHGEQRQLEIAMTLATDADVLLLDEPLAGMGAEETDRMLLLLEQLKLAHAVLLVEHDMDAVFRVADRITVMVNGEVIASDAPAAIRSNRDVQVAYLGEH